MTSRDFGRCSSEKVVSSNEKASGWSPFSLQTPLKHSKTAPTAGPSAILNTYSRAAGKEMKGDRIVLG